VQEELDDKRCAKVNEDGTRCGGFHVTDSAFCFRHSERAAEFDARRREHTAKREKLAEDLMFEYHNLRTSQDVVLFIEKLINGVLQGIIREPGLVQRITAIMPYLSSNIKAAGPKEEKGYLSGKLVETRSVEFIFQSDEEMDEFLQAGSQGDMVKMIEERARRTKKTPKSKDEQEVLDVEVLGSSPSEPDLFSCIDESDKEGESEKSRVWRSHKWKRKFLPTELDPSIVKTRHVCEACEKISLKATINEDCPNYED